MTIDKLAPVGTRLPEISFCQGGAGTRARTAGIEPVRQKRLQPWTFLFRCLLGKKISPAALTGWIIGKKKDACGSPDRMDYWEE
ncbi:hypothetical protein JW933_09925, partial [candidate division FCPU426 bacterium]|nr:hypothetical protein [candidate division FCPU426 bacterium]